MILAAFLSVLLAQTNLGSADKTCPASPTQSVEAAVWTGIPRPGSHFKSPVFMLQCIYCDVHEGCQDQSVYPLLDQVNFRWDRINAACFPTASAAEFVSAIQIPPKPPKAVEDGGGCSQ